MKYFVFNKPMDYKRGCLENCDIEEDSIRLQEGKKTGGFFSRVLDSREKGTVWHRMTSQISRLENKVRIAIFACDERYIKNDGKTIDVEEIIKDESLSFSDKQKIFEDFKQQESFNEDDILLHKVKGRYLWFSVSLYEGYEREGIGNIFVYFPKETWMGYLPSVYSQDKESCEFLESYLSVFKSMYDDYKEKITSASSYLDAKSSPKEYLPSLSEYLGIENTYLWEEEKLRKLIAEAPYLYKIRGTRKALTEVVRLYTGEEPLLVEEWQTREARKSGDKKAETMERLYGRDENTVVLLVKEKYLERTRDREALMVLLKDVVPAHIKVKLGILKPFMFLGDYVYLGVNSGLGSYKDIKLDGQSMLPFTAIGSDL